jgi:hypothetical protein
MPDSVRPYTQRPTTSARIVLFLLEVFRPILFVLGFVLRLLYRLLFSWWLNPLFDRWVQKAFADEIRQAMPFLFDRYQGRVIPDPRPEANDPQMDYVCVGTQNLIFKFARWRRENYEVRVSPSFAPTDSYELADALRVADSAANAQAFPEVNSWRHFSRLLEPRFRSLEVVFSKDNFQRTKLKLAGLRLTSTPG